MPRSVIDRAGSPGRDHQRARRAAPPSASLRAGRRAHQSPPGVRGTGRSSPPTAARSPPSGGRAGRRRRRTRPRAPTGRRGGRSPATRTPRSPSISPETVGTISPSPAVALQHEVERRRLEVLAQRAPASSASSVLVRPRERRRRRRAPPRRERLEQRHGLPHRRRQPVGEPLPPGHRPARQPVEPRPGVVQVVAPPPAASASARSASSLHDDPASASSRTASAVSYRN